MSDRMRDRDTGSQSSLAEVIDLAGRRVLTGLIIAGGAIGIGLYAQPGPARYQIVATDTGIARVNTRNGYVVTCEAGTCYRTLRPGQDLERVTKQPARPARPAAPPAAQRSLPAPEQTPSAQQPAAQPAQR